MVVDFKRPQIALVYFVCLRLELVLGCDEWKEV